ncbi:MAG: hypothetical protein LBE98_01670 [Puniceicoccales bacterium]|nr:hypothetical protein [Puniceicoccales bacterium]
MGIQDNDNTNKDKGNRDCQTRDTGNRYPDCLVAQTHRINALRQAIVDISGCFYHSKHVWVTLTICRYLANRLRKFCLPKDMAGCGWMVYQTICALYLQDHSDMTDEQCAHKVADALDILFEDEVDSTVLNAQLYRPNLQKWLPHQEFLGLAKWGYQSVMGRYPELPAPDTLSRLCAHKCLDDIYHYGIYGNIWKTLALGESDERIQFHYKLPKSVALEFRLMHLFSHASPEQMLSVCIMHTWETLGRRILDACGNSRTVSEAYDYLLMTIANER